MNSTVSPLPARTFQTFVPGSHVIPPIPFKAHKIESLSVDLLENHYRSGFGRAVRRLNEIEQQLAALVNRNASTDDRLALQREEAGAIDRCTLLEVFFSSIADVTQDDRVRKPDSAVARAIDAGFGSHDAWEADMERLARAVAAQSDDPGGCIVLAWSTLGNRFMNVVCTDRNRLPSGVHPVLAIDLDGHVFEVDFASDVGAYLAAFVGTIHWGRVDNRLEAILGCNDRSSASDKDDIGIDVRELAALIDSAEGCPFVLDVRHEDDRERTRTRILDTSWRDSTRVSSWSNDLPRDKPIVVYCMYGFWVSQDVATELRSQGYDARTLEGGIAAWQAMDYGCSDIGG